MQVFLQLFLKNSENNLQDTKKPTNQLRKVGLKVYILLLCLATNLFNLADFTKKDIWSLVNP